jgi:hypothetical protein
MVTIVAIVGVCIGLIIGFLLNAGIVWLICECLKAIGITTILGWTVSFSWPLVVLFTVILIILNGIFSKKKK